jgi:hypothetical protein
LFDSAQLAVMRDPTARRNYSAEAEQFRREHERHRAWGLKRRYAEKARRAAGGHNGSRKRSVTAQDPSPWPASAPAAMQSPASPGRAPAGQITAGQSTAGQSTAGQSTAGQSTAGPAANGQSMTRQRPAGGTPAAPAPAQESAGGTGEPKAAAAKPNTSRPRAVGPGVVEPRVVTLTSSEREELSRGTAKGLLCREIGVRLGRDTSIVSWKAGHDGGRAGYRAVAADTAGGGRAGNAEAVAVAVERSAQLRQVVTDRLRSGWSPTSIAGRSPQLVPDARTAGWHTKRSGGGSTPIPSRRGPRTQPAALRASGTSIRASPTAAAACPVTYGRTRSLRQPPRIAVPTARMSLFHRR